MKTLNRGDRVSVTQRSRVPGYDAGDKGIIVRVIGSLAVASDDYFHDVVMDKDSGRSKVTTFAATEIELVKTPSPSLPAE